MMSVFPLFRGLPISARTATLPEAVITRIPYADRDSTADGRRGAQ